MICRARLKFAISLAIWLAGSLFAHAAPDPGVTIVEKPTLTTFDIDAKDYNDMADKLVRDLLNNSHVPLDGKKVVALGPVDDDGCVYYFDARTLQEKLQNAIQRSGKLQVSFASDAMGTNTPAVARYNIMQLEWAKESAVSGEDLKTFGSLAKVDYILFGRVSAQVSKTSKKMEVTYTFNWKLGDCASGLLTWSDEDARTKSDAPPPKPEWANFKRDDRNGIYFYELGSAEHSKSAKVAKETALADAKANLAKRLNAESGFTTSNLLIQPFKPEQIAMSEAPNGEFEASLKDGHYYWVLERVPKDVVASRRKALDLWSKAQIAKASAARESDRKKKSSLENEAINDLVKLVGDYPMASQSIVQTEVALFDLAEMQVNRDVIAARECYIQVRDTSPSAEWKAKAEELLAKYPETDDAKKRHVWHKLFGGKRVGLVCLSKLDGAAAPATWKEMRTEATKFLTGPQVEAEVVDDSKFPAADAAFEAARNPSTTLAASLKSRNLDYLVIFAAEGKIEKVRPGKYQFVGELWHVVISPEKVVDSDDSGADIQGGRTDNKSFCMGFIALNRLDGWQENMEK